MDYTLKVSISRLKKASLYLFIFTNIAIFGTLFTHNFLTSSKYIYNFNPFSNQNNKNIDCNKNNNFCYDYSWIIKSEKLDQCPIYDIIHTFHVDNKTFKDGEHLQFESFLFDENNKVKSEYKSSNIFISFKNLNSKNKTCIKNFPKSYWLYKIFPQVPNLIHDTKLKPDYFDPTNRIVNPFFYGETSISNLAKRYPLYLIFKPFLLVASFLMIIYWVNTKKIILSFDKSKKIQFYYIFGVLSGVFLFFHVLFLGSEIKNEIFVYLRKYIIIFFIFFEILAQLFLIKKLLNIKEIINNFIKSTILQIKKWFVLFFVVLTILLTSLLTIFEISKEINYIIEWNYFIVLSFYYLLTFYLWKKVSF